MSLKTQKPLYLFKKRGCEKAVHVSLLIDELKGYYNIVLNIHLKFK